MLKMCDDLEAKLTEGEKNDQAQPFGFSSAIHSIGGTRRRRVRPGQ